MRIKELCAPAHAGGRFTIVFEDDSKLKVFPSVIADSGLYAGLELDEAAMDALRKTAGAASAKNRAVRIISAADVSKNDLEHRLVMKGESEEDARNAVQWLSGLNLVNDAETAERIAQQGARKGYGKARICRMLYEKRIPKQYWDAALRNLPEPRESIDSFLQKRFSGKKPEQSEIKRAADALVRRGHSWQDIQAGLRRYGSNLEDDPEA